MIVSKKIVVAIYFVLLAIFGFVIISDYGVHTDATMQIVRGAVNAKYIVSKIYNNPEEKFPELINIKDLQSYQDKDHGAVFEVGTLVLSKLFNYTISRNDADRRLFLLRHACLFLIFLISMFFFFKIVYLRLQDYKLALLAPTILILSPRILANSFYNSKDILFLSLCIIAFYFLFSYLRKKSIYRLLLAACFSGLAASQRIIGFIFPVLLAINTLIDIFHHKDVKSVFKSKSYFLDLSYLFLFYFFLVLFFPSLWENTLKNTLDIFLSMSNFNRIEFYNLYFGEYIDAAKNPWHYLPVWIGITTPIIILIFFPLGVILAFGNKNFNEAFEKKMDIIMFCFFLLPFIYILISNPVLYDGWRHMYFLAITLTYFTVIYIHEFSNRKFSNRFPIVKYIFILLLFSGFIRPIIFSIKYHPYQNVYFNKLISAKSVQSGFEKDYWGLSYKQGLEYILKTDKSDNIRICSNLKMGDGKTPNYYILEAKDKNRLIFVYNYMDYDYYITEFRNDDTDFENLEEIYSIIVDEIKILGVYKKIRN